jgi:predicted glutamine amidotransferase
MCQLLGMNANTPTDVMFSFTGLATRADEHKDGFGIGFFEDKGVRVFIDHASARQSAIAELVKTYPIHSDNVIAHIRKATQGRVALENTHPFVRELWGRQWVFAHNGTVKGAKNLRLGRFQPIGTTDSERAYCYLLETLRASFPAYPRKVSDLWEAIAHTAKRIGAHGSFNFLLGDGRHLYARCATKLCHIVRCAPFGEAKLADEDVTIDFSQVTTPTDLVAIVSTVPLTTNETWVHGEPGTMWVFDGGRLRATLRA